MTEQQAEMTSWDKLDQLLESGDVAQLLAYLEGLTAGETARALSRLDEEQQHDFLTMLPAEVAADIVEELADAQAADIIEELEPEEAAAIIDEMDSDEQADLLGELDEEDAEAILEKMEPEEAADARLLGSYEPETAGGLMITEYFSYADDLTTYDVIKNLQTHSDEYKSYDVQYVYVVAKKTGQLRGVVRVKNMVLSERTVPIVSLMPNETHRVSALDSLEELESFFAKHDFNAAPVVDEEDKLVGVVRRAHVEEALGDRSEKALMRFGGIIGGEELRTMPLAERAMRRLAFLLPNTILFLLSISIILLYEPLIEKIPALAVLLPLVAGLSGASGNQAIAVSIRELALGLAQPGDMARVLFKEAAIGICNGIILGLLLGGAAYAMKQNLQLGWVVGGAFAINSVIAVCLGGVVPLVLKRLKVDPAMSSGPVVTTLVDICAFLIVLNLANLIVVTG